MSDPCTCERCNAKHNRITSFGAIRRAVEMARKCERDGAEWMDYPYVEAPAYARGIREAIRAAIGSKKA